MVGRPPVITTESRQQQFLAALQDPEVNFDLHKAKALAGYPKSMSLMQAIGPIADKVKEMAEAWLAVNSLKASAAIVDALDNPTALGTVNRLKAAETVLDRIGLAKKIHEEKQVNEIIAVILLPPKDDAVAASPPMKTINNDPAFS